MSLQEVANIYKVGESIWVATIQLDGKPIRLGFFSNKFDASAAYDAALAKYTREYAGDHGNG